MITQGTGSVCSGHLWKSIFLDHARAAEAEHKREPPKKIISLANIIKSFKLYEDYQLSQQRDSFMNILVRQGAKGRTPSLPVMIGPQPGPPLSAWQLITVVLPRLTLTSHTWLKHPVCLCLLPEFPGCSGSKYFASHKKTSHPIRGSIWQESHILRHTHT